MTLLFPIACVVLIHVALAVGFVLIWRRYDF
jgi:hypothetical protein